MRRVGQAAELLPHHGAVARDLGCSPGLWQRGNSARWRSSPARLEQYMCAGTCCPAPSPGGHSWRTLLVGRPTSACRGGDRLRRPLATGRSQPRGVRPLEALALPPEEPEAACTAGWKRAMTEQANATEEPHSAAQQQQPGAGAGGGKRPISLVTREELRDLNREVGGAGRGRAAAAAAAVPRTTCQAIVHPLPPLPAEAEEAGGRAARQAAGGARFCWMWDPSTKRLPHLAAPPHGRRNARSRSTARRGALVCMSTHLAPSC